MSRKIILISLLLFLHNTYGVFEDRFAYGYHLRVGIPKAAWLKTFESLRIVGGSPVTKADSVPYQAGIVATLTAGATSICGGSLVSETRVLTAAHCWWDGQSQARLFTIVLGSLTIFSGGTRINTNNVKVHPSWAVNMMHDLAIVVVPMVTLSRNIQVIPLPTAAQVNLNFAGFTGLISGFGKTSDAQNSFPPSTALHQTTVTVITNAVCQNSFSISIHNSHLCTNGQNGKGTCDGDSGGPLTVVYNNKRILIGVVSFGPGEGCQAGLPSVFTRVTSYLPWIQASL